MDVSITGNQDIEVRMGGGASRDGATKTAARAAPPIGEREGSPLLGAGEALQAILPRRPVPSRRETRRQPARRTNQPGPTRVESVARQRSEMAGEARCRKASVSPVLTQPGNGGRAWRGNWRLQLNDGGRRREFH